MGSPESRSTSQDDPLGAPSSRQPFPLAVWTGVVLAWFGVCLCFILLDKDVFHTFLCPVQGSCDAISNSAYAEVRGIPLPWFGGAFYLVALFLWLGVIGSGSSRVRALLLDGLLWLSLAGLTFSAGLMYLQFGVLHVFCLLCTVSALNVGALTIAAFRSRQGAGGAPAVASTPVAFALGLFALFPLTIFIASHVAGPKTPDSLRLIDLSNAHLMGPKDAPVQLVVYSDFQCAYCRQLAEVLKRVEADFSTQVAVVYRHFPLQGHPRAFPAAVASECAAEQGAFWPYHDKLFSEGGDLSDAKLLELASELGLDQDRFQGCLKSPASRAAVESNVREAEELALPGAPFVFLNGERLQEAPTYENLVSKIKESLKGRATGGGSTRAYQIKTWPF